MAAIFKRFQATDLFLISNINLDKFTENYQISFYLYYLARWPELNIVLKSPGGVPLGYVMGKTEGDGRDWHGHVTALTVCPEYRRMGVADRLMSMLECVSEVKQGYFVDLFVRPSNILAVSMYRKRGYAVYRTVLEYYGGDAKNPSENAYDMRKSLARDPEKHLMVPCRHPVHARDI